MRTPRATLALGLVILACVGIVAGCGGGDDDDAAATDTTETTTETGDVTTPGGLALAGTVGPGFDIALTKDGAAVTTLEPGSYVLTVEDLSSAHNFHLTGPGGVDVSTSVGDEGSEDFTVELEAGTYDFVCDPHASQMRGSFEVTG